MNKKKHFSFLLPYFYIGFFLCSVISATSQNLKIKTSKKDSVIFNSIDYNKKHTSRASVKKEFKSFLKKADSLGFLGSKGKLEFTSDSIAVAQYSFIKKIDSIDIYYSDSVSKKLDFPNSTTETLYYPFIKQHLTQQTKKLERKGEVFSTVRLRKIKINQNKLFAELIIKNTSARKTDKLIIKGYENFPANFTKQYLKVSPKKNFTKNILVELNQKLNLLPFITQTKAPETLFNKDSTHIYVYLKKRNTNEFDGLIGFTNNNNGKLQFNGHLNLKLNNTFNKGETLSVFWSNNGTSQERFLFETKFPYVFKSPISTEFNFSLFKQDSSFLNIDTNIYIGLNFLSKHTIGINYTSESSSKLNSNSINNQTESFSKYLVGVKHQYLSKGYAYEKPKINITTLLQFGKRSALTISDSQTKLKLQTTYITKRIKRSVLYFRNTYENLISPVYYFNELFRFGGATTIRGFNELSLIATSYNYTNFEYRYLTGNESYLYTISDIGFTQNKLSDTQVRNHYSFGVGYAYKTKSGLLNLSYAFGKTAQEKFDLSNGIFHLKLTTRF